MRVLVTGAFGWTANAIIKALSQQGHDIIALDLPSKTPSDDIRPHIKHILIGSIADYQLVSKAVEMADVIVHLAVAIGHDDYDAGDIPFETNVKGTYHIFEAARQSDNISRIILIGSAPVHLRFQPGEKINAMEDVRASPDSDHLYDLTKNMQEFIAQDYCRTFGITAIALRAGHIVDGRKHVDPLGNPLSALRYCRGGWVCRYDLAEAIRTAMEYPQPGYSAFHVIGAKQARQHFDIERTEQELGFRCRVTFGEYAPMGK